MHRPTCHAGRHHTKYGRACVLHNSTWRRRNRKYCHVKLSTMLNSATCMLRFRPVFLLFRHPRKPMCSHRNSFPTFVVCGFTTTACLGISLYRHFEFWLKSCRPVTMLAKIIKIVKAFFVYFDLSHDSIYAYYIVPDNLIFLPAIYFRLNQLYCMLGNGAI